jgi:hypothetical protein
LKFYLGRGFEAEIRYLLSFEEKEFHPRDVGLESLKQLLVSNYSEQVPVLEARNGSNLRASIMSMLALKLHLSCFLWYILS